MSKGPDLEPLRLVAQDISIVVSGHRARVVFDMVFQNHAELELSGTLMIQIPNRAGPSYLGMYLGNPLSGMDLPSDMSTLLPLSAPDPDELINPEPRMAANWQTETGMMEWGELRRAVVVEPVKGRQVYESITRKKVDPALGEWTGTGSYATRIYPIPANGLKRVVFAYDQTLIPEEGKVVFPLPVAADPVAHRRLTIHDVGTSYSRSTVLTAAEEIVLQRSQFGRMCRIDLNGQSPSALMFIGTMRNPAFLNLTGADEGISGVLTTFVLTPETPSRSMLTPTGKALILLDTSYSSKTGMHDVSGRLLGALLELDDSLSEFAIVCFDVRAALLTSGFVPNTAEVRDHYLNEVGRIWLEGATDFDSALDYLEQSPELAQADTVFLLSDGLITWGSDNGNALARKHPELMDSRWICYSVGSMPQNTPLFDILTKSGGQIVRVTPSQDINNAARAHRFPVSRLDGITSMMQDEVIVAGRPEFVYPGQVLEVAVRTTGTTKDVRIIIRVEGRASEYKIPTVRNPLTDTLGARAWGEIYTTDLLSDADEAAILVSLSLSRHFNLTNQYASFIILETDEEYKQYEIANPDFDFRQIKLTLAARKPTAVESPRLYSGLSVPATLDSGTEPFIKGLASAGRVKIWETAEPKSVLLNPDVLVTTPQVGRESDSFYNLYDQGSKLLIRSESKNRDDSIEKEDKARDYAQALRVISTIAEIAPRDGASPQACGFCSHGLGLLHRGGAHLYPGAGKPSL